MNKAVLKENGIDYEQGVARCVGNTALYETLLLSVSESDSLQRAKAEYADKNYEKLFETIHEIKGVSGNLSMNSLFASSSELTEVLRAKDYSSPDLTRLFAKFVSSFEISLDAIKKAKEG